MPPVGCRHKTLVRTWAGGLTWVRGFPRRNSFTLYKICLYLWGNSHSSKAQFPTLFHFWMNRMLENISLWYHFPSVYLFPADSTQPLKTPAAAGHHGNVPALVIFSLHLRELIHSPGLLCCLLLFLYSCRYGNSRKTIWETQISASYAYYEWSLPPSLSCKILPT